MSLIYKHLENTVAFATFPLGVPFGANKAVLSSGSRSSRTSASSSWD